MRQLGMLIAVVLAAQVAAASPAMLTLEKIRAVDDPRHFDLRDPVSGDRGVPRSCLLSDDTKVALSSNKDATLEVERGAIKKSIVVEDVRGLGRSTLSCGDGDDFYYANPRHGRLYAYSAERLLKGEDPVVWTRAVEPFRSLDDAHGVLTDASIATVVQARQRLVMVEWFFRKDGVTGFWHEVFEVATGASVGKIGPSDLLAKTNEHDSWWILFQGGGNDVINYVPQNLYRLRYGAPAGDSVTAAQTVLALRKQSPSPRLAAVAKLSPNPVVNHMIALLTPTRTADDARIEFCPTVPGQRARYWLGAEYEDVPGNIARDCLLAFWAERSSLGGTGNPIDEWFQTEISTREPMKSVLSTFNPRDDTWIAKYQRALLELGGPTFERLFTAHVSAPGADAHAPK